MPAPHVHVHPHLVSASVALAADLRARVQAKPELVLGLPTGNTPKALYAEMVRLHDADGMNWSRTRSFNLDEYWPMAASHPQSFTRFMREQLFEPAQLDPSRTHVPSGDVSQKSIALHCAAYEAAIKKCGGIEIQILGVGVNGHIGFNEPGTSRSSRTDLVELSESTRERAVSAFAPDPVPNRGITMGLGTILEAKEIVVLAFGAEKADAVATAIEGPIGEDCPASLLQEHPSVRWFLDEAAASRLTKRK
jgi:glucosamine-6-phosphate deaminase